MKYFIYFLKFLLIFTKPQWLLNIYYKLEWLRFKKIIRWVNKFAYTCNPIETIDYDQFTLTFLKLNDQLEHNDLYRTILYDKVSNRFYLHNCKLNPEYLKLVNKKKAKDFNYFIIQNDKKVSFEDFCYISHQYIIIRYPDIYHENTEKIVRYFVEGVERCPDDFDRHSTSRCF